MTTTDYANLIHARWHIFLMGLHSLLIRLNHQVLDTQDPSLLASTQAPVTTSSNTLLQSDDALHCMAGLSNWAVADCCLLSLLMDGCRLKGHHRPCTACPVFYQIHSCQPTLPPLQTPTKINRLNQIHSHGILSALSSSPPLLGFRTLFFLKLLLLGTHPPFCVIKSITGNTSHRHIAV
jgi:hypothetical protein